MINLKDLVQNPEKYKENLKLRGLNEKIVDEILEDKDQLNKLIFERDQLRAFINKFSKIKPDIKIINEIKEQKQKLKKINEEVIKIQNRLNEKVNLIPNLISKDVPPGKNEEDNVVLKVWGNIYNFDFEIKDHVELGKIYDLIDIDRASKIAGSRFYYLKNEAVLLEFALINFVYDLLNSFNFIPIIPPVFIKEKYYQGMGRLSNEQKEERYYLSSDDLYLIGSAEHTIGSYYADEILDEKELPKRFLGFSTCFRREAGSYGKDVRGILRTHQFDKIEMFSFTLPEESEKEHEFLLSLQEKIMQELNLPYRVVLVCSGDIGFTDYKQYDIETWIPSQNKYRETHSCSNTTDFQARGVNTRVKRKNGKLEYLHMLNATALAIGRTLIAILENYQRKDYIEIPEILHKYLPFKIIKK